ncbi:MAG: hypothetical protein ACO1TE_14355 [Prosthecobacter sp.]
MRLFLLLLVLALPGLAAQAATQTVILKPGWNSVWVQVEPADPSPAAVFAGVPVQQAWCYFPKDQPVEFIEDPDSGLWNRDAWSVFIPSGPEAFLTNLHAVQAHRPYLIKLGGSSDVTLTLTGEATHRPLTWRPKSFNLAGFAVDPVAGGGGVGSFFFNDAALKTGAKFKLSTTGQWVAMGASDIIRNGEAYWLYADASTEFNGALNVAGDTDFGVAQERATVEIANTTAWPMSLNISAGGGFPLVKKDLDAQGNVLWTPLASLSPSLAAGGTLTLELGVQRRDVSTARSELLTITGGGSRIQLPLKVDRPAAAAQAGGHAGLWVGSVTLNQVAEVNVAPTTLRPTPAEMRFRIILHVNAAGQVRLLKSVISLWKDGVRSGSAAVPDVPGRHVLVTDDTRIPDFKGAVLKDGRPFGHRISSVAYEHPGTEHAVTGTFGGSLSTRLVIAKNSPTHPFRHKYHPDHDGLDPQYQPLPAGIPADQEETWDITRDWQMTFQTEANDGSPSSGYDQVSGIFTETLTGMHRLPLRMGGIFELKRVSTVTELNPAP